MEIPFARSRARAFLIALALLLGAVKAEAASVTLAWDASPDVTVTGYVVQYGVRPGIYTGRVDVGTRTQYSLVGLAEGTYYFSVQAYNADGVLSDPSTELSGVVKALNPPTPAPDLDGDRRTDPLVWRSSTGTWYWLSSVNGMTNASAASVQFGDATLGDVPMSGDVDGDRIADLVIWRASTGTWQWVTSSTGYSTAAAHSKQWGNAQLGDVPMLADIDGDELSDLVVWRASTGTWFWLTSSTGYDVASYGAKQWGNQTLGDVPIIGDFDGDRRADLAVWRASTGTWYWLTSSSGYAYASGGGFQWGNSSLGDKPLVGDFDGDKRSDLVVWRASSGTWFWLSSSAGYAYASARAVQWGSQAQNDRPSLGDMDGDGRADLCVWRPAIGTWFWLSSSSGYSAALAGARQWGSQAAGDIPIVK